MLTELCFIQLPSLLPRDPEVWELKLWSREKEGRLFLGKWASLIHESVCSITCDPFLFPLEPVFKNCALKKKHCWWFKSTAVASKETNVKSSCPHNKCHNHSATGALLLWILLMGLKESFSLRLSQILKKKLLWGLRSHLPLPSSQCLPKEALIEESPVNSLSLSLQGMIRKDKWPVAQMALTLTLQPLPGYTTLSEQVSLRRGLVNLFASM